MVLPVLRLMRTDGYPPLCGSLAFSINLLLLTELCHYCL
jgi:hypothetical protein